MNGLAVAPDHQCTECPAFAEVKRLKDALVAADELLRTLGVERATPTTWDELIAAVQAREGRS
ncbi:MAG: hypothetical protein GX131_07025 [candidate division WS1 bacterium]|jgi:hypothetical protein|nr:hypothetical protein [candidate division WS1 bacterium]